MIEDIAAWGIVVALLLGAIWLFVPGLDEWGYRVPRLSVPTLIFLRLLSWACLAGRIFLAILVMRAVSRTPDGSYWFFFGSSIGVYLLYDLRFTLYLNDNEFKF